MILSTAAVMLSRKIAGERTKKKEMRQERLVIGNSEAAKRHLTAETAGTIPGGIAGVRRSETEIKFEDPDSLETIVSPSASSPGISSPTPFYGMTNATPMPQAEVASPVRSEKASIAMASPADMAPNDPGSLLSPQRIPPPYSPRPESATPRPESAMLRPSVYSRDSDSITVTSTDRVPMLTTSSHENKGPGLRIHTRGSDLKSGFAYHPALFELNVHPERWDAFTTQLVETTKLGLGDHAQMWAAATGMALTGAFVTSVVVGRAMNRRLQEKKVKTGLEDMSDGGLGEALRQWNETYFRERGLFAHLELSESAMKHRSKKSQFLRKESTLYSSREERERKREERKFVIVVTRLDDTGAPTEAAQELAAEGASGAPELLADGDPRYHVAEMPAREDAKYNAVEMPADEGNMPVELPADLTALPNGLSLGFGNEKFAPPVGLAELDSETTQLMEKTTLEEEPGRTRCTAEECLSPPRLTVSQ